MNFFSSPFLAHRYLLEIGVSMITPAMREAIIPILSIPNYDIRLMVLKQYLSGFHDKFIREGTDYTYLASYIISHGLK